MNDDIKIDIIIRHYAKELESAVVSGNELVIAYYKGVLQGLASAKNSLSVGVESIARVFGGDDDEQSK